LAVEHCEHWCELADWSPRCLLEAANQAARRYHLLKDERELFLNSPLIYHLPDHFSDTIMISTTSAAISKCSASASASAETETETETDTENKAESLISIHSPSRCVVDECYIVLDSAKVSCRDRYPLSCGLVLKLRTALLRLMKRSILRIEGSKRLSDDVSTALCVLYTEVVRMCTSDVGSLAAWPPPILWRAAAELSVKAVSLSGALQSALCEQPLLPSASLLAAGFASAPLGSLLHFSPSFLALVEGYHKRLERPEGTFDPLSVLQPEVSTVVDPALIGALAQLPREECEQCHGRRQVYCGSCGGRRLPAASELLPDRIDCPFDILLIVHWFVFLKLNGTLIFFK
jgi:hypothetical protein